MAGGDNTSIWKKEISFRRKPKESEAGVAPQPPVAAPEPSAPAKAAEPSVWKKEISFRRKPKQPAAEPQPPAVTAEAADVREDAPAEQSIWKKEIAFRRKPKLEPHELPPVSPPTVSEPVTQPPVSPPVSEPAGAPPVSEPAGTPPVTGPPAPLPVSEPVGEPVVSPPVAPPPVTEPVAPPPVTLPPVSDPVAEPPISESDAPSPLPPLSPAPPVPETSVLEPDVPETAALAAAIVAAPDVEVGWPEPAGDAATDAEPSPTPEPAPDDAQAPSRRQRRQEQRVADRLAKEYEQQAKQDGKERHARHNQLVGLKIGASQIAAAQVINRGGPRIVRMARVPLKSGVVVGGELREPEELASTLKTFFRKNKLPRNCVRLGISNNRIGVRTFEVTGIEDPQQLANAIRFRAQETLPIPIDEAVLDHRVLDDRVGEDGVRVCTVLLVVAHRELVERYVTACRKAGLKLVGIDLEAFALLRAMSDPASPPGEDAAVVCVSIGHDRSTLAVSDGRVCQFTRVLAWGGASLEVALARTLDLTPSAVVPIKHALSLGEGGESAGLDAAHAEEARRALRVELQGFARELVASLRFYQEQPNSLGIVEIVITGGAATAGGLADELEQLIGIPVRVGDPLLRVRRKASDVNGSTGSTASMAVAVGLGIED